MVAKAINDLTRGMNLWHVWVYQAYHEISAKYRRTVLGSLWIAGGIFFTSLSMAIVFGGLFHQDLKTTLPYIMAGLMSFAAIGHILNEAPEVYMANAGIISNHAYPFTYYNFEGVAKNIFILFHNIVVLEIILISCQSLVVPHWSFLIGLPIVAINMFTWGSVVGMMSARFRDLRFLLPYTSQVVMFASPIVYHPEQMSAEKHWVVQFNPFYPFIEMLRAPLLGKAMPIEYWPMAGGVTIVGAVVWLVVFSSFRKRIAFWV